MRPVPSVPVVCRLGLGQIVDQRGKGGVRRRRLRFPAGCAATVCGSVDAISDGDRTSAAPDRHRTRNVTNKKDRASGRDQRECRDPACATGLVQVRLRCEAAARERRSGWAVEGAWALGLLEAKTVIVFQVEWRKKMPEKCQKIKDAPAAGQHQNPVRRVQGATTPDRWRKRVVTAYLQPRREALLQVFAMVGPELQVLLYRVLGMLVEVGRSCSVLGVEQLKRVLTDRRR